MTPWHSRRIRIAVATIVAVTSLLYMAAAATAATDFTWNGNAYPSNIWSIPNNWLGGFAPNGSVGTLIFPAMSAHPGDSAIGSADNFTALSVNALSIDDASPYAIGGGSPAVSLTIGAGGLTAATSSTMADPPVFALPLVLGAAQTWQISGGPNATGELVLEGGTSGSSSALQIALDSQGLLALSTGLSNEVSDTNEVGDTTVTGADPSDTGLGAYLNGAVALSAGATLDATDGHAVQLTDAAIFGAGTIGPVTSTGGAITAGAPLGSLRVNGDLTLDSASALQFAITDSGATAGTDYSQLAVSGSANLANAMLDITGTDLADDCPTLTGGAVETLLTTTGSLTGTFANIPNGAVVQLDCAGATDPNVQINYTAHAVTATAIPPTPVTTATTLTISQTQPTAGQPVSLTATVTTGSGLPPSGTIDFESDFGLVQVPGCTAVPLTVAQSSATATCTTSSFAKTGLEVAQAVFNPANPLVFSASTSVVLSFQVVAVFTPPRLPPPPATATVSLTINGSGSVISSAGPGIRASCPGSCSGQVSTTSGTSITFSALPASGWHFAGWSGACSGNGPCSVTPASNASLTATFSATVPAMSATPRAPSITKVSTTSSSATIKTKKPANDAKLICALIPSPTAAHQHQRSPVYSSCGAIKTYRHLHKGSYTVYIRAVSRSEQSKPTRRRFTIS
jgi:Divergent InlB B-repeat domain